MIIDDLDIAGALGRPAEADPELIVDPDRMLTGTIADEWFQTIPRGYTQITKFVGGVEISEFSARHFYEVGRKAFRTFAVKDRFRQGVSKGPDHRSSVSLDDTDVTGMYH